MTAFDAAVLLVADGLVAVGRVLGGLHARCAAEKHADTLAVFEEDRDALEPGELLVDDKGRPPGYYVSLDPKFATKHFGFPANPESHSYTAWDGGEWLYQPAGKYVARWEAMSYPTDGDPYARIKAAERSAAVSTPAADNTTVDHLEAAWHYHRPQANYNGDLVWGCEGCNWSGRTIQAHSRHRFQVLADMKNATHRIQEQLGGAS